MLDRYLHQALLLDAHVICCKITTEFRTEGRDHVLLSMYTAHRYAISRLVITKSGVNVIEKTLVFHVVDQQLLVGCKVIVDCSFNITTCLYGA